MDDEWCEHEAAFRAAVAGLLRLASSCADPGELLRRVRVREKVVRQLSVVDNCLVAGLSRVNPNGAHSTAALLVHELRIAPAEASMRVRAAEDLAPRVGLTGEVLPPLFELVVAAQERGEISAAHARVIVATVERVPPTLPGETELIVQRAMTKYAAQCNPVQLQRFGRELLERLDPDGTEPVEERQRRERELRLKVRAMDRLTCRAG